MHPLLTILKKLREILAFLTMMEESPETPRRQAMPVVKLGSNIKGIIPPTDAANKPPFR